MINLQNIVKKSRNVIFTGLLGSTLFACGPDYTPSARIKQDAGYDANTGNENPDAGLPAFQEVLCNGNFAYIGNNSGNLEIFVCLEIRDSETKEIKTDYKVGERALFYITAKDLDCERKQSCGDSMGINYCILSKDEKRSLDFRPDENGIAIIPSEIFESPDKINVYLKCQDSDQGLEAKTEDTILNVKN